MEESITLKPIEVSWDLSTQPIALAIKNDGIIYFPKASQSTIKIKRTKFPSAKLELLVIPKNKNWSPLSIPISDETESIRLKKDNFSKIKPNEFWLWGYSPKSRCQGRASYHIRVLNKLSIFSNLHGLFAFKLSEVDLPDPAVIYITPILKVDTPQRIKSKGFEQATERDSMKCLRHHGAACEFVFKLKKEGFGRRHQMLFDGFKYKTSMFEDCPV